MRENPSSTGTNVTFAATVAGVTGGAAPGGTITFRYTPMGGMPVMLVAGSGMNASTSSATVTTATLPAGVDTITATYSGDANYAAGTPGRVTQTATKATASTAVTSSTMGMSSFGQSVTFTATVSGVDGTTPTGTIAFTLGGTPLGSGTMNGSGVATLATTALPVGTNGTVTATYSGDANFATSNGITAVTVNPATITLTVPAGSGSGTSGNS